MAPSKPDTCPCSEKGCLFYRLRAKFIDSKFDEDLDHHITLLTMNTVAASYQQMTTCIVEAFCGCLEACKRKGFMRPDFYHIQFDGKLLPLLIILNSPSGSKFRHERSTRCDLLSMILPEQLSPSAAVRNEMYLACAQTGFDPFFRLIRQRLGESNETQSLVANPCPVCHQKLNSGQKEEISVNSRKNGFELEWTVPDFLQRLKSNFVGTQFVACGMIWGLQVSAPGGNWEVRLCVLRPSQFEGTVYGALVTSKQRKGMPHLSKLTDLDVSTTEFPMEGAMPLSKTFWSFSKEKSNKWFL